MPDSDKLLPEIITTEDGSHSLFLPGMNETYHSRHGAAVESQHVFIKMGLEQVAANVIPVKILEVGFGTGLNAWLTWQFAIHWQRAIHYTTLETNPLPQHIYSVLNYAHDQADRQKFITMHGAPWNEEVSLHPFFTIEKKETAVQAVQLTRKFDLVYYDAFGPPAQPEMWTKEIFERILSMMKTDGIFVTYCAKGQVRRDLEASGFKVERLQGPPGKREMLRATKY